MAAGRLAVNVVISERFSHISTRREQGSLDVVQNPEHHQVWNPQVGLYGRTGHQESLSLDPVIQEENVCGICRAGGEARTSPGWETVSVRR